MALTGYFVFVIAMVGFIYPVVSRRVLLIRWRYTVFWLKRFRNDGGLP